MGLHPPPNTKLPLESKKYTIHSRQNVKLYQKWKTEKKKFHKFLSNPWLYIFSSIAGSLRNWKFLGISYKCSYTDPCSRDPHFPSSKKGARRSPSKGGLYKRGNLYMYTYVRKRERKSSFS